MTETGRPETREWSYPGSAEIHTILWDGLLPPPDGTPHAPWCQGCRIEALLAVVEAAQEVATTQSEALKVIQQNGFVFEDIGKEPGNWQHLAFTLYTMLCEIDSKLTPLLDDLHSQASDEGKQ